jgi:hypothetical protein
VFLCTVTTPTEHTETLEQENGVSCVPETGSNTGVHVVPPSAVL